MKLSTSVLALIPSHLRQDLLPFPILAQQFASGTPGLVFLPTGLRKPGKDPTAKLLQTGLVTRTIPAGISGRGDAMEPYGNTRDDDGISPLTSEACPTRVSAEATRGNRGSGRGNRLPVRLRDPRIQPPGYRDGRH